MAFNTQEQEIIKYGIDVGKSREEVEQALFNFRNNIVKPVETLKPSSYIERVKSSVKTNLTEALESEKKSIEGTMNPFAAGANIAKNVTGAIISPVVEGLRPVTEKTIAPVLNAITEKITNTETAQKFIDFMSQYPELSGAIADTFETGLNVAAIEGTIGAGKSVVSATGKVARTVESEVKNLIEQTKQTVASLGENAPSEIMNRVARLKPTDINTFKKLSGKTPGEYLSETGNFGAPDKIIATEAQKYITSLQQVDDALAKLPGVYTDGSIVDALKGLLQKAQSVSGENIKAPYLQQVTDLIAKYNSGGLTMAEINVVKRLFERNVKLGYNKLLNAEKVEQATNIDSALRGWQLKQAESLGFENLLEMNKQTQLSRFIIDKLGNQIVGQSALNGVNLTDWIVLSGGDVSSIAGFLTKRFFSNKAIQAKIAELLQGETKSPVVPTVKPTVESSLRTQFPQGTRTELPAPTSAIQKSNFVPIERTPAYSVENPALRATKTTINPKTGDQYIRDVKTGEVIAIIRGKKK